MTSAPPHDVPRPAPGEVLAAVATGIAAAAAWLAASAIEHDLLPFGAHGRTGWWIAAGVATCTALVARVAAARDRAAVAAFAAVVLAVACVARAFVAAPVAGIVMPGAVAIGCVLALGTPRLRRAAALPLAVGSAALLGFAWTWRTLAGSGTGSGEAVACAFTMLAALLLAVRVDRAPAMDARPASAWRAVRRAGTFAAAVVALAFALSAVAAPSRVPPLSAGDTRVVATSGDCAVVYARATQELRLHDRGELVDAGGPDRCEGPLAVALVRALLRTGDRVLVLGGGAGRTAAELQRESRFVVDCADWRPAAAGLRAALNADGPVRDPSRVCDGGDAPRCTTIDRALRALGDGVRQAIVLAEAMTATSREHVDARHELARVVGRGVVLQLIALDRAPSRQLHELFAAAAAAHAWNGLFVVGDGAVLASAEAPPDWSVATPLPAWSDDARWAAHAGHIGGLADLRSSLLGTFGHGNAPPPPDEDGVGRAAALGVVRAWIVPAADAPAAADVTEPRVLARWAALRAEVRAASARIRSLPDTPAARADAQSVAARFLPFGAPAPELQAALGLPNPDGATLLAPELAGRRAHAIDPTFFAACPAIAAALPRPFDDTGPLEDLAVLPAGGALAAACVGDDPLAVALRVRFPSRCARALVAALAAAPLSPAAASALRELADPFVLAAASDVLAARSAVRELLGLWRLDLPMPASVVTLAAGSAEDRRALAAALRGRKEPTCHPVLAALLEGDDAAACRLAGEALWQSVGDRVPYDADWPLSARREAAERLRALHNRAP